MQKFSPFRRILVAFGPALIALGLNAPLALAQAPAATAAPKVEAKASATTTAKPAATTKAAAAAPAAKAGATAAPEAAPLGPTTEQQAAARTAFEGGKKAYDAGDYVAAEAEFRKAYELIPVPHAEYWIASSVDKQGKDAATIVAAYELFLSNPGASHVGEDKVAEAKGRVAELKKTLPAKYTFTTEPVGATVTVDGIAQTGVTPVNVELTPGPHKIQVALEGYESSLVEIQVEGGALVEQPITLTKAVPVAAVEATPAPVAAQPRSKVPAYVTLGLGGAGLVLGTVFGILALDAKSKYDANPTAAGADDVERNALIADMSFGVALTLGITGVVLITAKDEAAEKPVAKAGRVLVAPYGGPMGGGARAQLSF